LDDSILEGRCEELEWWDEPCGGTLRTFFECDLLLVVKGGMDDWKEIIKDVSSEFSL
jgi:hypothetical protein